jgi:sugar phosphate isomerase/epimerase
MIKLAVSSHWIAYRHVDGNAMADEINEAGFDTVELGYDTPPQWVPGIQQAVTEKRIRCRSLHNFCPVPEGIAKGHPESFSLSALQSGERQSAVYHTRQTIAFAATIGAETVVSHAGNIAMRPFTPRLVKHYNHKDTPRYDRLRAKAALTRRPLSQPHMHALCLSIEELLPDLESRRIKLAFENLPSLEAIPSLDEQAFLFQRFPSPHLCYWHDFGHAQILQNLQIAPHFTRLQRFQSRTAGMHIHDTTATEDAHTMPPLAGGIHWEATQKLIHPSWCLVLEPAPGTPVEAVQKARDYLEDLWNAPDADKIKTQDSCIQNSTTSR